MANNILIDSAAGLRGPTSLRQPSHTSTLFVIVRLSLPKNIAYTPPEATISGDQFYGGHEKVERRKGKGIAGKCCSLEVLLKTGDDIRDEWIGEDAEESGPRCSAV